MSQNIWIFGREPECDAALAAINAYLGLPNEAAQRWAEKRKAPGRNLWWFDADDYPRREGEAWVWRDVEAGLGPSHTPTTLPDNANIAAVEATAGPGKAVKLNRGRARAIGIEPDSISAEPAAEIEPRA